MIKNTYLVQISQSFFFLLYNYLYIQPNSKQYKYKRECLLIEWKLTFEETHEILTEHSDTVQEVSLNPTDTLLASASDDEFFIKLLLNINNIKYNIFLFK